MGERGKLERFTRSRRPGQPLGELVLGTRESGGPVERHVYHADQIPNAQDHGGAPYLQHLKLRAAILDGGPVEVTMEDGLRAVVLGLAAEQSAREKRAIELRGFRVGA